MESFSEQGLVDGQGRLLSARIQDVLRTMRPQLRARMRMFHDDALLTEVLEEAGTRITEFERKEGPVENLRAYARTTVMNVASSRMRRSSARVEQMAIDSADATASLATARSTHGTAEQIEMKVFLEQVMSWLSEEERALCVSKQMGFSSREIARQQRTTIDSVNSAFYRIKRKVEGVLTPEAEEAPVAPPAPSRVRTA